MKILQRITPLPWKTEPHTKGSGPGTEHDWTILGGVFLDYHEDDERADDPTIEPTECRTVIAKVLGNATSGDIPEANARYAALAANLFPELVTALRDAIDSLEYVNRAHPESTGWGVRAERISQANTILAKIPT